MSIFTLYAYFLMGSSKKRQGGSISCTWHFWSQKIACCIFHNSQIVFKDQNKSFLILDKRCPLLFGFYLIEPDCQIRKKQKSLVCVTKQEIAQR